MNMDYKNYTQSSTDSVMASYIDNNTEFDIFISASLGDLISFQHLISKFIKMILFNFI